MFKLPLGLAEIMNLVNLWARSSPVFLENKSQDNKRRRPYGKSFSAIVTVEEVHEEESGIKEEQPLAEPLLLINSAAFSFKNCPELGVQVNYVTHRLRIN